MKIQDYNDGAIYRTGVHSYEVRTSHGIGKGSTVAEALKDLATKQAYGMTDECKGEVEVKGGETLEVTVDSVDSVAELLPAEKPKKRKSKKKKKSE